MKRKKIYTAGLLFIFPLWILTIASCRKFIEAPVPTNSIVTSEQFADSAGATSAITGIYTSMNGFNATISNGSTTLLAGVSSDEMYSNYNPSDATDFFANAISLTNQSDENLWKNAYKYIYQANACIAGTAASSTLTTSVKKRITGEALFMRAFFHFYLVNMYGPVPLAITIDYQTNAPLPRTSVDVIYNQIIADLKMSQKLLSTDPAPNDNSRVNQFAAGAFLARVYLYQKQWSAAESAATAIISANFKLEPILNNVFLASSREQIWQLTPVFSGNETTEGQILIPPSPGILPQYVVTNSQIAAFESGDQRAVKWLNYATVQNKAYAYPYKYKLVYKANTTPTESYSMLRLAEQYLIRAEARAQQNNLPGALADINTIRSRAGLPNSTAITQTQILNAVMHERQTELFCEWGHRWFDLKRTGTIDAILSLEKLGWKSSAALFPIPYTEIQLNPSLTQNPGY
jgi:hypothetical protein